MLKSSILFRGGFKSTPLLVGFRGKQVFDTFTNIFYCSIEYELYFVDGYGKADEKANMTWSNKIFFLS